MDETTALPARTGSPDAWVELHADSLYRHARGRVANDHEAHDVVQETLIAGWRARSAAPDSAPPNAAWLHAVLRHKLADHYRRLYRERGAGDPKAELLPGEYDRVGHWEDSQRPRRWKEPSENDSRSRIELREALDLCLAKLPVGHARVFMLREVESLDTEEILAMTGISESNLFVMLHRARAALRRCMEDNHFARGDRKGPVS